jgi:hypothetical protein
VREKYSGSVPAQTTTKSPLAGLPGDGSKIVVSNLPDDVSENQIRVSPRKGLPLNPF